MKWTKYQSLGNDFLVAELAVYEKVYGARDSIPWHDWVQPVKSLCNRNLGFGADGVILYRQIGFNDFDCLLINCDGSAAGFSGNGFACLAKHCITSGEGTINHRYDVSSSSRSVKVVVKDFQSISDKYLFTRTLRGQGYSLWDVGNEHAVFVKKVGSFPPRFFEDPFEDFDDLSELSLETHFDALERYPDSINIGIALVCEDKLQLKVRERGCGWTEACSSGAVAAFLAVRAAGLQYNEVNIMQVGGSANLRWHEGLQSVDLTLDPQFIGSLEYEYKR